LRELTCYRNGMLKRTYDGQNCSIARALEIVGERWTLLIIRDALLGLRRFDEFQRSLGIPRKVLAERLRRLVDEGLLERVRYQERPERYEYQLTRKGRDLHVALVGLRQWGDAHCSEKPPLLARTKSDKKPVIAALIPKRRDHLRLDEVEFVPGPGR
jgi:DNA-binding HxlR family transcriptional regulator